VRPRARACAFGPIVVLLAIASPVAAQDLQVEATVNAERIGLEDVLELTVAVSGSGASGDPELPDLPAFRVAGRSTSQMMQIANGHMSSTHSYIYQLLPQKEGKFTIGAVAVEAGGKTYRTRPIGVEVVTGSVVSRRPRGFGIPSDPFADLSPFADRQPARLEKDEVFVKTEISKRSVYQGEGVVVTYRLYSHYVPLGLEKEDDPPLTGFWVEEVNLDSQRNGERRTVDGKQYFTFPLKQRVIFPTKTGTLQIPPVTFSMSFRLTSGDPFDAFFARASSPVTLRSPAAEIQSLALPAEGRGNDFSGAVGQYRIDAHLDKDEVASGDAVSLKLSIEGSGSLRSVTAPQLPELKGFRTFAPKTQESAQPSEAGLEAKKSWEYVLVPESGGTKEIGPWRFQYFDPVAKKYVTESAGPIDLKVTGSAVAAAAGAGTGTGTNAAASMRSSRGDVTLLRQDIRFLKPPPARVGERVSPFVHQPLFYGTLLAPLLWNVGLLVYLRRKESEKTHSSLFRSRRAHRLARARLKTAAKLAEEASRDFYEEIAGALYRYVADKTSTSPSGLTTESIEHLLAERSVPEDLRKEFLDLLGKCEEARFTPGERTRAEMERFRSRTEELIVSLERHWS
jgi:BatD DUF11 like domain